MARYFFDTEFIEDGKTIDLISIGMVCEQDGRELYLCNRDAKLHLANDWVRANVLPHLPNYGDPRWLSHAGIAEAVRSFAITDTKPEFWAYYADYDWVALCQLFGTMMDLPSNFPKYCRDLKQLSSSLEIPRQHPPQPENAHDALADARWNLELYRVLTERR